MAMPPAGGGSTKTISIILHFDWDDKNEGSDCFLGLRWLSRLADWTSIASRRAFLGNFASKTHSPRIFNI